MGAFYGHMNHLYDNGALTFGMLKQILTAAAEGELMGTEKLDGMNLYVSYSVKEGKAKAVRNATNIRNGGLDAEELAAKFEGREGVEGAFNTAFQNFERAIRTLSVDKQTDIFGKDADIFYNSEVIDERTTNVVNYNNRALVIHRVGHVFFNKRTNMVEDMDISENLNSLNHALDRMNNALSQEDYSIQINAIRNLQKFFSDEPIRSAIDGISAIQERYALDDRNHINDYLAAYMVPLVKDLPIPNSGKNT